MFKEIISIVSILIIIEPSVIVAYTYTCYCYCSSTNQYQGTATSYNCDSASCTSICQSTYYYYCSTYTNIYGTCSSSSISDTLYSTYGTALNIAQIIGIVVGSLAGAITLTIIIVVIVCVCKKKRYQGVIIRPQYPGPVQTNMMYNQAQHPWSTPAYQQPYINPAYNSNLQYPPTYPSAPAQPPRV